MKCGFPLLRFRKLGGETIHIIIPLSLYDFCKKAEILMSAV
jgi:hypothetical protein